MKILIVTCSYMPYLRSGVSSLLEDLNAEFIKLGHEVYVFCARDSLELPNYHVETTLTEKVTTRVINIRGVFSRIEARYNIQDYNNLHLEAHFLKFLNEINPEIIHFHAIQGLGANLISVAKKLQYSVVLTMHDFWWFCPNLFQVNLKNELCHDGDKLTITERCLEGSEKIEKDIRTMRDLENRNKFLHEQMSKADLILTNSRFLKKVLDLNGVKGVEVNENGILFPTKCVNRKKSSKPLTFGFMGGLSGLKGSDIVQRVFHHISAENAVLQIYGVENFSSNILSLRGRFGYYFRTLFSKEMTLYRLINKLKSVFFPRTSKNIIFKGIYNEEDVYSILFNIDMLIIASRARESFSLIARKAFVSKTPVITSNCGGPEEIVKDGVNGYVVKAGDWRDLLSKINLVIKDPSIIEKFSNNIGVKKIRSITEQAQELLQYYTRIKMT